MKLRQLGIALAAVALIVGASNAAVWNWSKVASSNATADPTINWSEGQSPSSVNDSARAMMARLAEYRDDISGVLATTGTSTAYLVTTNQVLNATPTNGQLLAFTPHVTNGASATLAADGGTAFPLQTAPSAAVAAGVLVLGTPYTVKFNSSAAAWILRDFYANPFNVPVGGVMVYLGSTAPNSNFALPFGQCISRTTYAALFALVSTAFGACDGSTTFAMPDLRGRVVAGLGNMGGSDAGRITAAGGNFDGTIIGNTGGSQNHTNSVGEMVSHTHTASSSSVSASGTTGGQSADHSHTGSGTTSGQSQAHTHSGTTDSGGGSHNHGNGAEGSFDGTAAGGNAFSARFGSAGNTGSTDISHTHTFGTGTNNVDHTHTYSFTSSGVSAGHTHDVTVTGTAAAQSLTSTGSGTAYGILSPTMTLPIIVRIF